MDFIPAFMRWTSGIPSPEIFRLWSAIGAVAAAAERRVFLRTAGGELYPNLYTLLVAAPAIGKTQAIRKAETLLRQTKRIFLAADGTSKAALLDQLAAADRKIVLPENAGLMEYHSLAICADEFGTLVPSHDTEFLSVLNAIYDNKAQYADVKRTTRSVDIAFPQLNILAGTQPGYLANLLPEEAWSMGFMSRNVMIYASQGPKIDFFNSVEQDSSEPLVKSLYAITKLIGEIGIDQDALTLARDWLVEGQPPIPDHSKLTHYCGRRNILFAKLMIVSCLSRSEDFCIIPKDVLRAKAWMLQAEHHMADVFREMVQKNDSMIIQELHLFLWGIWAKTKKPVHKTTLVHFLMGRMPHDKVLRLLDIAEISNIIEKLVGTETYRPRARHEHGVE